MNAEAKEVAQPGTEVATLQVELDRLVPEITKVLPEHVTPDKFMRTVATAIVNTPALRTADRRSLMTSAIRAATDGLLPDGREGAFVIFNSKSGNDWISKVQWMPMVAGILKKVRNSGELLSILSNVVHAKDHFKYWIDDAGEHVQHEPNILEADRGPLVAVYAIAKTKDSGVYTEVMSRGQIDEIRNVSKAKDSGPWVSWYSEMARKSVIRRLSKRLPMSTDLETVIRRDDELTDFDAPRSTESSGAGAARRALGLIEQPTQGATVDQDGVIQPAGEAGPKVRVPQFDVKTAVKSIKQCQTIRQLDGLAADVRDDFVETGREVPVEVTAAIDDRRATIQAAL